MELRSTTARKNRMLVDHHEHINIDGRPALKIRLNPRQGKPNSITLRFVMQSPAVKLEQDELHRRHREDLDQEIRRLEEVLRRQKLERLGRKLRRAEKRLHRLNTQAQTTTDAGNSQTVTSPRQPRFRVKLESGNSQTVTSPRQQLRFRLKMRSGNFQTVTSPSQPRFRFKLGKVRSSEKVLPELTQDQMKTEED
jgi:hypothetical protein